MAKDKSHIENSVKPRDIKRVGDDEYDAAVEKVAHAPKLTDEQIRQLARRKRKSGLPSKGKP
ncbi:hypothetical protein [Mesorhizobium abyssinicae]|uniref:hypothetical protein n=1 Tax=Mesorhizobium abyssinicae TaxID=1209958 RepID=UPI002A246CEC|nr:hypothetical protein [Mesorhizobium abyssinicae]